MLGKIVKPKTKAELLKAIQAASFKSFDVLEGDGINRLPSRTDLTRWGATVIILKSR